MIVGPPVERAPGQQQTATGSPDGEIIPGAVVLLRGPRRLRGTTAIVRREVTAGWEVEIRSPAGTPMHLVLPASALEPA